jgi:hypothetical protein
MPPCGQLGDAQPIEDREQKVLHRGELPHRADE